MPDLSPDQDQRFAEYASEYMAYVYASQPVFATQVGVHEYDDRLATFDPYALADDLAAARRFLHGIDKLSVAQLTGHSRIDYRIARSDAQITIATFEQQKPLNRQPHLYLDEAVYGCFLLMARDFADAERRAALLLSRLRSVPRVLKSAKTNIKSSAVPFVDVALRTAEGARALFGETVPGFAQQVQAASLRNLLNHAAVAAAASVDAFILWLKNEVAPKADQYFALGRDQYDYHLRVRYMLDESAESLLAIGEEAVARTQAAMDEVAKDIDPTKTWVEIVADLKCEHPPEDSLAIAYAKETVRAREFLRQRDLVTFPENESLQMVETPEFARPLLPYAAYMPAAAFELKQVGQFWVTPVNPRDTAERREAQLQGHSIWGIPVIALHEAYPGHHLQISLANQHPSRVRRHFGQNSLFAEGWALYCEEMMWEEGFYTDSRTRLLQLKDILWRACRVVVDTGLHTRGMSPAEAVDYMVEVANLERPNAEAEVRRYCISPTQPMTYLMGKREVMAIREVVRRRRRKRFSLRTFHDKLLSYGTIPPRLIREDMGI